MEFFDGRKAIFFLGLLIGIGLMVKVFSDQQQKQAAGPNPKGASPVCPEGK